MSVTPLKTVGHATTRIDARQRVTGKATYTNDVQLPGMLFARVLRSPHPHAWIRSIAYTTYSAETWMSPSARSGSVTAHQS